MKNLNTILISQIIIISVLSACGNSYITEQTSRYDEKTVISHNSSHIDKTIVVKGESMSPTFHDGDRLIISHMNLTPEKGDVLVMNSYALNETIIKRCIGTEGDRIVIDYNENTVKVNGENVSVDYINEPMRDNSIIFDQTYCVGNGVYEYTVPEGKIFVMGDNRNHSTDSRSVGFIDVNDIIGEIILKSD